MAARPEELALPKVAVPFEDMFASDRVSNVQVQICL
jgi:hypothetical protein